MPGQIDDEADQAGPDSEENLKSLWELASGECHWPIRDEGAGKHLFCGRQALLKSRQAHPTDTESYCALHLRLSRTTIRSPFDWRRVAAGT